MKHLVPSGIGGYSKGRHNVFAAPVKISSPSFSAAFDSSLDLSLTSFSLASSSHQGVNTIFF